MNISITIYIYIYYDLYRFSKLRAWYRYLPFEGRSYLLFPWVGEQPRNHINPEVSDSEGLHWWVWEADFIDEIPIDGIGKDIIMRRPVKFNCFLRGLEGDANSPYMKGLDIIKKNNNLPKKITSRSSRGNINQAFEYARESHSQQIQDAVSMAIEIYNAMEEQCPEWIDRPGGVNVNLKDLKDSRNTHKISESSDDVVYNQPRSGVRRTQSEYITYTPRGVKLKHNDSLELVQPANRSKLSGKLSRKKNEYK